MIDRIGYQGNLFPSEQFYQFQRNVLGQVMQHQMLSRADFTEVRPPYTPERGVNVTDFVSQFRDTFQRLSAAAEELAVTEGPMDTSVLYQREVQVEDREVLEAQAEPGAAVQEFEVEVEQLAREQIDETAVFYGEEEAEEVLELTEEEEFELRIVQDEVEEEVTLEIDREEDTIRDVLERLAGEIEARDDLEIEPQVREEGEDLAEGEVRLELAAAFPGEAGAFRLEDVGAGEGLWEQLQVETVQEAADAQVEIEGLEEDEYQIAGDTVTLDEERVMLELEELGETTVEIRPETDAIRESIEDLVAGFHQAMDFVEEREASVELRALGSRLGQLAQREAPALQSVGVDVEAEGRMAIRGEELEEAIQTDMDRVEEVIGGFARQVGAIAEDALRSPPSRFMEETGEAAGLSGMDTLFYDRLGRTMFPLAMHSGLMLDLTR